MMERMPGQDAGLLSREQLRAIEERNGGLGEYFPGRDREFLDALVWRGEQIDRLLLDHRVQTEQIAEGLTRHNRDAMQDFIAEQAQQIAALQATRGTPCRCDPPGSGEEFCTGHCFLRQENAQLRAVLQKAKDVIERSSILFHPDYLLRTDALLKECEVALAKEGDMKTATDSQPKLKYGALREMEIPDPAVAPNGAVLTKGEWLVLEALRFCRKQTGQTDHSVKRLSHVLGWGSGRQTPIGVVLRIRRMEAKGVLVTSHRFTDDEVFPDHYDIVGEA